jgi:hypothetical protein
MEVIPGFQKTKDFTDYPKEPILLKLTWYVLDEDCQA